ncbi:lisH domain-containing protein ARMC9 isoform X1 [Odontomachus brunneus]|nr:lisH domain-containing protein ARMC9 isoform X1 [Odontomachus brunneus]XP_032666236.1 lisH domain-containing protein ARMC9 isoform X1 [Odontomachus brunneus]XP_032666237.1 lisH domain-containing protein ARMC9 isoform X1 [Odontomachus brunneus]XP_032666238.1 lisH domain-containing protein ARMC9 isoform X1 [Odontomachus brunneus]
MKNQMADKSIKEIYQFLVDHNFESTAESLVQEASKIGFQNFEYKLKDFMDPHAQLILCYNVGNYSTFFQLWNDVFSDSTKQCKEYKKLTFYLHVYFAILPICKLYACEYKEHGSEISTLRLSSTDLVLENHKKNSGTEIEKNINNNMKQLQDYLNGDGKELEYDMEFQPFYTLPFTKDLHANTLFSKMLEPHWLDELSKNLDLFITDHRQDLDDLSNMSYNKIQSQNAESAQSKTTKDNIPIITNDRDIPIFFENNDEEQYGFGHKINRSLKSSGTQTRIIGDQIKFDNSQEYKSDVGESVDSLPRMHKQDRRLIQCNQELTLTKDHLYNIHANYEKLKSKFHKLHVDYNKLINIARELTIALENSLKGQTVDVEQTLEICTNICPDLFNKNIKDISYTSLLQRRHSDRLYNREPPRLDITTTPVLTKLLDFKKIKLHLVNGDVKTKLLLLQALRWKVTTTQSTERNEVLHEYMSHDLLGLHGQIASDSNKPLLPCLLTAGEAYARHLLQQFIARLLNTLASFRYGRDYLSVGSIVVNVTFDCLNNADGVDSFACDMLVAMLQKLSLRRQQRIYMIESGLLEWLIGHLHDNCRVMNLYRLEYATALLMNLSLHRLAHARAAKISSLLMSTLLILLSIDHTSSLQYINETLNNFLSNPVINEEARKMKRSNMSDYIDGNLKTVEIRKHLDHILKMQRRENVNTPQNEETADDDNEERDILESELDENDPLKNCIGELNGETLLEMCYSISASVPEDITIDTTLKKIFTLNSMNFYNDQQNNHLYTGRPSHPMLRDSSETVVTSSMTLASGRENSQATEVEKFSSIASLNANNYDSNVVNDISWKSDLELAKEEDAFLAKPKISRTPP